MVHKKHNFLECLTIPAKFFCLQFGCLLYIYFPKRWGGISSRGGKAIRANHRFFAFVSFSRSRRMRREASSVGRPRFRGPGPPWGDLTSWENSLRLNLSLSLFTFLLPLLHSRPSWKEVEKKEKTTLVTRWQRKRWTLISLTPRWFCIFHRSLQGTLWTCNKKSSRFFDLLNSMIYDLNISVGLRWLLDLVLHSSFDELVLM